MSGPRRLLPALAAVVVLLAGCTPTVRWVSPNGGQGGSPSASPSTAPSIGPAQWRPCPEVARDLVDQTPANVEYECATVGVPQDWNTATDGRPADGKTFGIALLRARSTGQTDRIGSLVVNPGGPGASGIDLAVYLSLQMPAGVARRFDIVGFDPRGVGRSAGVECYTGADLDAYFGGEPDPVSDADFDTAVQVRSRMANACAEKYGDGLRLYSTEQSARDIDAIRAAVGDEKLTYLGYSYGTLLGAVYAQLFPTRIRAMVLDGAVDPTAHGLDSASDQVMGFERAFDNFATWCRGNPGSCPIAPDARAAVMDAMSTARTSPSSDLNGRRATPGWIMTAVVSALYSQAAWPQLANAISLLRQNRPAPMFTLADRYAERDTSGAYSNLFDAFLTVSCTDDDATLTPEKAREVQAQWRQKYPLFGSGAAIDMLICGMWSGPRDPYPTGKAVGAPPIVVVGTTGDPATPYEQTAKLAEMLGVGVVLTWQGEGHTAYPQTRCINEVVGNYLVDLKVPAAGTTCPPR